MTKTKKGGRRAGRRRAFEVLYGLCFTPDQPLDTLRNAYLLAPDARQGEDLKDGAPVPPETDDMQDDFAYELVSGVWREREKIDETINRFSQHWKLSRIARVELTILRVALYEMLLIGGTPLKVAINEAVELAKRYGDDSSKNFVNGILDAVAKAVENGELRAD